MIENAARALVLQEYFDAGLRPSPDVEGYVDQEWPERIDAVCAVLDAIREPSEFVIGRGVAGADKRVVDVGDSDVVVIWQAMIDSALAEVVAPMLQPPKLGNVTD